MGWFRNAIVTDDLLGPVSSDVYLNNNDIPLSRKKVIGILLMYFLVYQLLMPILATIIIVFITLMGIDLGDYSFLVFLLLEVLLIVRLVKMSLPLLKIDWLIFRENLASNIVLAFKGYITIIGVNILISNIFGTGSSENQMAIEESFKVAQYYILFLTVVFAPIVEEIVFRIGIFRNFRNRLGYMQSAVLSGFIFGLMHVLTSLIDGNFGDLINILSYMSMGIIMGVVYEKSGSVFTSILTHLINNGIAMIILFVLLLNGAL